ncbi:MAG: hypothetical protein ACODAU_06015 [Myxococcota bacterium]
MAGRGTWLGLVAILMLGTGCGGEAETNGACVLTWCEGSACFDECFHGDERERCEATGAGIEEADPTAVWTFVAGSTCPAVGYPYGCSGVGGVWYRPTPCEG